ncbi:hypothetical protein LWI28_021151 [Acer negundo]|uniref:Uncharacterized protein n=1 Tax=Acer negundo TaxID=4023 RepID=A0AAD5IJP8_ACENE|nr:hypothetical protein LWI28_021151 [Acer negundo]
MQQQFATMDDNWRFDMTELRRELGLSVYSRRRRCLTASAPSAAPVGEPIIDEGGAMRRAIFAQAMAAAQASAAAQAGASVIQIFVGRLRDWVRNHFSDPEIEFALKREEERILGWLWLAWVEFANVLKDCWNEVFFKRLGWVVGELLLIDEETLDRRTLANGKVSVLIPKGQKRPKVFKVNTRRQNFTVFIKEDPEPIKYKVILSWLGLDWFDSDGETSSSLGASDGGRCGGSDKRHVNEEALGRPDIINDKPQIQVNQSGVETNNYVSMGNAEVEGEKRCCCVEE